MKITKPQYFDEFKCIADKCEDTCCRFWQVELDAVAYDTVIRFNHINIRGKKNRAVIVPCKNGNCPFLEDTLLCSLYKAVGHDNLPRTCRIYPRFINTFGGYEEQGLSFSCPAAAKLIYSGNTELVQNENDSPIESFTDVDAEVFSVIKKARALMLDYLNNTDEDITILIGRILAYTDVLDKAIKENDLENEALCFIPSSPFRFVYSRKIFNKTLSVHLSNSILRNNWKQTLKSAEYDKCREDSRDFKIWFSYFIYRYLLRAAEDLELISVINSAILSYFFIVRIGEDPCKAMQLYSKEIEHNEKNLHRLFKLGRRVRFI